MPRSSKIELHHDASIVAALRASSPSSGVPARTTPSDTAPPVPQRPTFPSGAAPQRSAAPAASRPPQPRKPKSPPAELRCPRCRSGTLLTGSRGWGCSRWREGCRFVVWFEVGGKKLTTTQLRELVTKGTTKKKLAGGEARLVLDAAADPSVRVDRA